jgi:hypothetical protein
MAKQGIVTNGTVAFSNLTEHDTYKGKSTGSYSLTVTLDDAEAAKLSDMGVNVKTYTPTEGDAKLQRKFKSQYHVAVVDMDNRPMSGEIPYGSQVRILWTAGEMNADYGLPTYMQKVRVVELSETSLEEPEEF